MELKWVSCPVCGRRLFRTDGKKVYIKCRGTFYAPNCRILIEVDPATGKRRVVDAKKEGVDGK